MVNKVKTRGRTPRFGEGVVPRSQQTSAAARPGHYAVESAGNGGCSSARSSRSAAAATHKTLPFREGGRALDSADARSWANRPNLATQCYGCRADKRKEVHITVTSGTRERAKRSASVVLFRSFAHMGAKFSARRPIWECQCLLTSIIWLHGNSGHSQFCSLHNFIVVMYHLKHAPTMNLQEDGRINLRTKETAGSHMCFPVCWTTMAREFFSKLWSNPSLPDV